MHQLFVQRIGSTSETSQLQSLDNGHWIHAMNHTEFYKKYKKSDRELFNKNTAKKLC
jgi:hypothetical protein